ncbi:MAG TPA: ABC transporter permease, partial [Deltaproteobacteria bacterium]|nr:ABC transporter permease [Deltaproteobacteria bacterium]
GDREILPLLARGDVRLVLDVPPAFEKDLAKGRPVAVQSLIDGVFPYRAQVVRSYVAALNADFNAGLLRDHLVATRGFSAESASERAAPVRLETRYLFNQALRSEWSMASGLIMLVLMFAPPFLTSLGVVREKENGSIYNIYASTITRGEFILGKLLPYVAISAVNVLVLWCVVIVVHGAPFKGDPIFFYVASVVYVACTTGIGLLVSLWVRTQAAAALLTMVITFIPAMLYSGLMVPLESLGPESRIEAHLFPPIYYLEIVWGSFFKGLAWRGLGGQLAALVVYAAVLWTAAILSFRKRPSTG